MVTVLLIQDMLLFQNNTEQGLFFMNFEPDSLQDFLHVDNLTQAHEQAGRALSEEREHVAVSSLKDFYKICYIST